MQGTRDMPEYKGTKTSVWCLCSSSTHNELQVSSRILFPCCAQFPGRTSEIMVKLAMYLQYNTNVMCPLVITMLGLGLVSPGGVTLVGGSGELLSWKCGLPAALAEWFVDRLFVALLSTKCHNAEGAGLNLSMKPCWPVTTLQLQQHPLAPLALHAAQCSTRSTQPPNYSLIRRSMPWLFEVPVLGQIAAQLWAFAKGLQ